MKNNVVMAGVLGVICLAGSGICSAEKWDKNNYEDATIASSYYDAESIKLQGKVVTWTEKYLLTREGGNFTTIELSKHPVCKKALEKKGEVTHYQLDYQIETGKFRGIAKRYYNKGDELLCTDKDTGSVFNTAWYKILRGSPIEQAKYDLATKYQVKFQ